MKARNVIMLGLCAIFCIAGLRVWSAEPNTKSAGGASLPFQEAFEGDVAALQQKGWNIPGFASVVGDIPGANGQALRVQVDDPKKGKYAELYIPVETGKCYQASVRIRAEGVKKDPSVLKVESANRGAVLFLELADKNKKFVKGGSFPAGLIGDKDWTEVKVPYTQPIPEKVAYLHVLLGVEGQGTAYFDDLRVGELVPGWSGPEIVRPSDGATVRTRRPVFEWKPLPPLGNLSFRYRLELSRDPAFPAKKTITVKPLGNQAMPKEWLEPGTWYYRVVTSGKLSGKEMPPPAAKSFVVAPDAVAWPPTITPSWSWTAEPRPELSFRIEPQVDAQTQFAVTIDGVPAEILGNKAGEIRFRATTDLVPGAHPVKLTATAPGQEPLVAEGVFSNKQVTKKVSFRDDRVMLVDGKPFYPIGTYRDPSDRNDDFTGIQQAGFNITHSYDFEHKGATIEKARAYLDAAQAAGVKVFMGIPREWFFARDWNAVQQWVAALMDHPALLVWYLMDEPEGSHWNLNPALLRQLKDTVKAADPFHPAAVVYFLPEEGGYWAEANAEDIAWHDPYPIGSSNRLTQVGEDAAAQRKSIGDKKPMWTVIQGHDYNYWPNPKALIEKQGLPTRPTRDETRFFVFQGLTAGTDGFLWYWAPRRIYRMVEDAPTVWSGIVETSHLLKRIEPWLVASPKAGGKSIKVPEPFRIWTREVDGKRLLVLVNTGKKSESIDLDLSSFKPKAVTNFETGAEVALSEGRLKAAFAPMQVLIYQINPMKDDAMASTKDLLQPIVRLTPDDAHYFFGYYDIPAWSGDDSAHLVYRVEFRDRMPTPEDVAQLGLVHPGRDGFTRIAETTAWNFQQGAMLQWHPLAPDRKIIFNRRDGGRFVGVIKDIVTGEEQVLPRAVSNVDPKGRYAMHVNFSRQFDFRPGYGYAGIPDPFAAVKQPEEDGIIRMDLESGKETLVMSLAEIVRQFPGPMRDRKIIVNHINLNTDGSRFIALIRNFGDSVGPKSYFTGAITADADGRNAYMLVDYSIASHYHWRDPENLVMVVKRPGEQINLREFRDRSQESHQLVHEFFKDDGHCSYSPDRQWLLYDSYPQEGYRYLYVYHLASGQGWCLGGVKTLPRKDGVEMEIRCDLHPRWNRAGDAISFDSIHEGFRGVYSMKIGPLLRQWAATTTQGASVKK